MSLLRFPWRCSAALVWVSCFALMLGCSSKEQTAATAVPTVTITGKITFVRIPLLTNASGVPLGLETDPSKFLTLPASGINVRFLKANEEVQPDGSKVTLWSTINGSYQATSAEGLFSGVVTKGDKVFIEVLSRVQPLGNPVRIVADAAGMYGTLPQADRTVYALRKGLDGNATSNLPGSVATADAVVNFEVGLNDKWWITQEATTKLGAATREDTGTGSRILAIAHSVMKFNGIFGNPTPGAPLDLHYRRGIAETRGTFVEYDRDLTPLSFDGYLSMRRYFGSVRGSLLNDDAFDEGVLLPLFARNHLVDAQTCTLLPVGANLSDLSPDLALMEGFAPAMAATILKTPFLADTTSTGVVNRDIRDLSMVSPTATGVFSVPLITALSWEIALKAATLPTPGLPTDWAKLDALTTQRFFIPKITFDTAGVQVDLASLYGQIARLQEVKVAGETIDLAAIFTDTVLTAQLQPFKVTWPRPTTGPVASFLLDWGKDPNTLAAPLAPLPITMAKATEVRGTFPNVTVGEVNYAKFTLTKDTAYDLYVTTSTPLPAGALMEVFLDGAQTFLFDATTTHHRLTLRGLSATPVAHSIRTRLLSPSLRISDTQATVHLDVAP